MLTVFLLILLLSFDVLIKVQSINARGAGDWAKHVFHSCCHLTHILQGEDGRSGCFNGKAEDAT